MTSAHFANIALALLLVLVAVVVLSGNGKK